MKILLIIVFGIVVHALQGQKNICNHNTIVQLYPNENQSQQYLLYLNAKRNQTFGQIRKYFFKNITYYNARDDIKEFNNATHEIHINFQNQQINQNQLKYVTISIGIVNKQLVQNQLKFINNNQFNQNFLQKNLNKYIFLDSLEYSKFILQANNSMQLLNTFYSFKYINSIFDSQNIPDFTFLNKNTELAQKLCFGNKQAVKIPYQFQNTLRNNVPLWTFIVTMLLFWIFLAVSQKDDPNCFNQDFNQNKYTSWSLYSLWNLGNQNFFTKYARYALFYFNFTLICSFPSYFYQMKLQVQNVFILWLAVVSLILSQPFVHIYGYLLNRLIQSYYQNYIEELNLRKIIQKQNSKQIIEKKQKLQDEQYFNQHFYYTFISLSIVALWIVNIVIMNREPFDFTRGKYHDYWLATIALGSVLNFLVYQPLVTYFFGLSTLMKKKGYFYRFEIGQTWQKLQQ